MKLLHQWQHFDVQGSVDQSVHFNLILNGYLCLISTKTWRLPLPATTNVLADVIQSLFSSFPAVQEIPENRLMPQVYSTLCEIYGEPHQTNLAVS